MKLDKWKHERALAIEVFRRSGLTQEQWAEFCGLSQGVASGIIKGIKGSKNTFNRIAKAHGFKYSDYFDRSAHKQEQEAPAVLSEEAREIWAEIGVIRERIKTIELQIKQHEHPQNGRPRNTAGGR